MHNAIYAENKFEPYPQSEKITQISFDSTAYVPDMVLCVGVKTLTYARNGLKLHPHKVVVIELSENDEVASFSLDAKMAEVIGNKLIELSNKIRLKEIA